MVFKYLFLLLLAGIISVFLISSTQAQYEDIPYESVLKICEACACLATVDSATRFHQTLDCAKKNFQHILSRWPAELGRNHQGTYLFATFSGNSIELLQQLPATNSSLIFSCRHCGIKKFRIPLFMDVPYIKRLDLSWNIIKSEELTSDIFRGPFGSARYQPIALLDLDFSHNQLQTLPKNVFAYLPQLKKLNLAYNQINVLDRDTFSALTCIRQLEILDLSNNELKVLPIDSVFRWPNIKKLNLANNVLKMMPGNFHLLGQTIEVLNLAGNQITDLDKNSFFGLSSLKRLNISDMGTFNLINNETFASLTALEYLHVGHNPKLEKFDLVGLLHSANLTYLDLSNCDLSTLLLPDINVSNKSNSSALPWAKLRTFDIAGNPWYCGCELFQTLEYIGVSYHQKYVEKAATPRCDTPYILSGTRLSNLTLKQICAMNVPKKYMIVVDEDSQPRFLRKRYIMLTAIIASAVIVLGLIIGFLVVFARRRLKNESYEVQPVRYTSVRCSNFSASFIHQVQ